MIQVLLAAALLAAPQCSAPDETNADDAAALFHGKNIAAAGNVRIWIGPNGENGMTDIVAYIDKGTSWYRYDGFAEDDQILWSGHTTDGRRMFWAVRSDDAESLDSVVFDKAGNVLACPTVLLTTPSKREARVLKISIQDLSISSNGHGTLLVSQRVRGEPSRMLQFRTINGGASWTKAKSVTAPPTRKKSIYRTM